MMSQTNEYVCIILCLLSLQWMSTTTAHSCTLHNTSIGLGADCSHRQLTRVPTDLPSEIVDLDMHGNELGVIHNDTFVHVSNLIHLIMYSAEIYYLEPGAFNTLNKLVILNLQNNILRNISKMIFLPLKQLDQLIFHRQRTMTIVDALDLLYGLQERTMSLISLYHVREYHSQSHPVVTLNVNNFRYLKNICVSHVSLSRCSIVMIEPGTFSSLRNNTCRMSMDLSGNVLAPPTPFVFELSELGSLQFFNVCCQGVLQPQSTHALDPAVTPNVSLNLPPNLQVLDVSHLPVHSTTIDINVLSNQHDVYGSVQSHDWLKCIT
jgi:hypothetical protein